MSTNPKNFSNAADAQEPQELTQQQYFELLKTLASQGKAIGKTSNVTAFHLPPVVLETLTDQGEHEATNKMDFEKEFVITFDRDKWPLENDVAVNAAIEQLGANWGKKTVAVNRAGEGLEAEDLEKAVEEKVAEIMGIPDLSEAGVYVQKKGAFEEDYIPTAPGSTDYAPNPEGVRLCVHVDQDIKFPVNWYPGATFDVPAGGIILTRERDIIEIISKIANIANEVETASSLYDKEGVPVFDVWGAHPGFREDNYGDVSFKADTTASISALNSLLNRDQDLGLDEI